MPNTSVVQRPSGTPDATAGIASVPVNSSANITAYLADGSNTTYDTMTTSIPSAPQAVVRVPIATFALPALSQLRSITPRIAITDASVADDGPNGTRATFGITNRGGTASYGNGAVVYRKDIPADAAPPGAGLSNFTGNPVTTAVGGGQLQQSDLDNLDVYVNWFSTAFGTPIARLYEVFVDVQYNQVPTATPAAITTPQLTWTPTLNWSYADPEGDVQERIWIKVFTAPQTNPDSPTIAPSFDSGEVFQPSTNYLITLTANGTYYAYIKVADAGSNGRYSVWSSWTSFVATAELPNTPVVTAVYNAVAHRAELTVSVQENLLQNQNTGGGEDQVTTGWAAGANTTLANVASPYVAQEGLRAFRLTATAGGNVSATTPSGLNGVPVLPLTQYTVTAQGAPGSTQRTMQLQVDWFNAAGAFISSSFSVGHVETAASFSQETATFTSPANAAFADVIVIFQGCVAAEVHYFDAVSMYWGTLTTWSRSGLLQNSTYGMLVQASDDGGVTWKSIRTYNGSTMVPVGSVNKPISLTAQSLVIFDYEIPPSQTRQYRVVANAVVNVFGGGLTNNLSSAFGTAFVASTQNDWYLSDPSNPALGFVNFDLVPPWARKITRQGGLFHPLGRHLPVVVSDTVSGIGAKVVAKTYDDTVHAALIALLQTTDVLLIQAPISGVQFYIQIASDASGGGGAASDVSDSLIQWAPGSGGPIWQTEFEYVEIDAN